MNRFDKEPNLKNIQREQFSPANSSFPKCVECGTFHPKTLPGTCPIVKAQIEKVELEIKGNSKITSFIKNLKKLLETEDGDGELLKMLNLTILAWMRRPKEK